MVCVAVHAFYTIGSLQGFCWSLSIGLFIHSHWWLCSWWWRDCIEFSWGQFECAFGSFAVHFAIHIYFSSLANGSLCFLFKLPRLLDCGCWFYFSFYLLYIFKFVFSFYREGLELVFDFFLFSLILKLIYVYFLYLVFHFFFGRICCFMFCWVVFGIYLFFFIKSREEFYGVYFNVGGCFIRIFYGCFNRIFYVHWAESVG